MSRAVKSGWDFVEAGKIYQYKEDSLIALIKIMEDDSDDERYRFRVRILKSNIKLRDPEFTLISTKRLDGYYSGMPQIYELNDVRGYYLPNGYPYEYPEEC
jgi:hypothetical protein